MLYKQIIRPIIAYAFPSWFTISSCQMEKIRRWERRILCSCLDLPAEIMEEGTRRRPTNRAIYDGIQFARIDCFLMDSALSFLEKAVHMGNPMVTDCFDRADPDNVISRNYFRPVDILALKNGGHLSSGGRLLFYHRRYGTLDIQDTVYNTTQ